MPLRSFCGLSLLQGRLFVTPALDGAGREAGILALLDQTPVKEEGISRGNALLSALQRPCVLRQRCLPRSYGESSRRVPVAMPG